MDISKKDWKLFRERLSDWQENYMKGLVKEYVDFLNDDTKHASEKFWELEKRIREDKRSIGAVVDMRRSQMYSNLLSLLANEIIQEDDLDGFSEELAETIKYAARKSKGFAERI